MKLTEHYMFIQLIIKCIRKHIKHRKKITRITHLTHGYENLEFENNLPLLYSFNKAFAKSTCSSSTFPWQQFTINFSRKIQLSSTTSFGHRLHIFIHIWASRGFLSTTLVLSYHNQSILPLRIITINGIYNPDTRHCSISIQSYK